MTLHAHEQSFELSALVLTQRSVGPGTSRLGGAAVLGLTQIYTGFVEHTGHLSEYPLQGGEIASITVYQIFGEFGDLPISSFSLILPSAYFS